MSGWYVKRNDQKYGQYTSTQLVEMAKQGQVLPLDWVAKGESEQWIPASQVKGLFPAKPQVTTAPVLPAAADEPAADAFAFDAGSGSDDAGVTVTSGHSKKRTTHSPASRLSKRILAAIAGGVLMMILVVVYFATRGSSRIDTASPSGDRQMKERIMPIGRSKSTFKDVYRDGMTVKDLIQKMGPPIWSKSRGGGVHEMYAWSLDDGRYDFIEGAHGEIGKHQNLNEIQFNNIRSLWDRNR